MNLWVDDQRNARDDTWFLASGAAYLDAVIAEDDTALLAAALGDVAARGA